MKKPEEWEWACWIKKENTHTHKEHVSLWQHVSLWHTVHIICEEGKIGLPAKLLSAGQQYAVVPHGLAPHCSLLALPEGCCFKTITKLLFSILIYFFRQQFAIPYSPTFYCIQTLEEADANTKSDIMCWHFITLLQGCSWTDFVSNVSSPSQDQLKWQLCSYSGILFHISKNKQVLS